jgi:hypothetical protein
LTAWAVVSSVRFIWDAYHLETGTELRLRHYHFCRVLDAFTKNPPYDPSSCVVETHEYQLDPQYSGKKYEAVTLDLDTMLMVEMDVEDPDMKAMGPNHVSFDTSSVLMQIITGPYSGRKGLIERHKIERFSPR